MQKTSFIAASALFLAVGAGVTMTAACTTFDGLSARSKGDEIGGGADGGPGGPGTPVTDLKCKTGGDCPTGVCGPDGKCLDATATDGVKNASETDIDCGGDSAPKCAAGKHCKAGTDGVWGYCTADVCEAHQPGRKDGDQTDIDCGGTMSPACDWDKDCLVDTDC